jgi:hypothetical protein
MAYIFPAPGVATVEATLTISDATGTLTGTLLIPATQDITINNANDVFTWTQLDSGSKLQVATTATNSLDTNIVLDQDVFFGTLPGAPTTVANAGIFGLSKDKVLVGFSLFLGKTSTGGAGTTLVGQGYITGLAPTASADAPVWVSPLTITVSGDITID